MAAARHDTSPMKRSRLIVAWFVLLLVAPLSLRLVGNQARDVEGTGASPFPGIKPVASWIVATSRS